MVRALPSLRFEETRAGNDGQELKICAIRPSEECKMQDVDAATMMLPVSCSTRSLHAFLIRNGCFAMTPLLTDSGSAKAARLSAKQESKMSQMKRQSANRRATLAAKGCRCSLDELMLSVWCCKREAGHSMDEAKDGFAERCCMQVLASAWEPTARFA